MPARVLIVPDKFKGTLTAPEAARAIARGWQRSRPADSTDVLPMSDGGDGFGHALGELLAAEPRRTRTLDAAHQPIVARWWWEPRSLTAIFDSATVIGLSRLPEGKFHPFELDTFGLGALIFAARKAGARRCIVGLGGSATNDAGFGLARALGWTFLDVRGKPLERWTRLDRLDSVVPPEQPVKFDHIIAAADCRNPLLGSKGATRVYGPQKGIRPAQLKKAERCHHRLARIGLNSRDHARVPGAGAAGGLGFGFLTFLGARIVSGFELFASEARLDQRIGAVDLVITGEGQIDRSSFMGKGVGEVLRLAQSAGVQCIVLAGSSVLPERDAARGVYTLPKTKYFERVDHARRLESLAAEVARDWKQGLMSAAR